MKETTFILMLVCLTAASSVRNLQISPFDSTVDEYTGTISINVDDGPSVTLRY